jgi:hypothetical protein
MSRSKVIEIFIGVCVISSVITVQVMIAKHERAEETKQEPFSSVYDGGNK